jgi:hypothetical protein
MKALNFAILKYFSTHDEADADIVMEALKPEYEHFRAFKKPAVVEALMAAKENGLLDETRFELENDNLRVYYKANDYGRDMIDNYIK